MKIIHVISDEWGPFVDIRACWQSCAERDASIEVIVPKEFNARWPGENNETMFVLWDALIDPGPRDRRDCYVAAVWSEALDTDLGKMLPEHRVVLEKFLDIAHCYDAVFVHTPWMRETLIKCMITIGGGPSTFVMPVGWDLAAMGTPRWDAPKHLPISYRGSRVGRRLEIIPKLKNEFKAHEFVDDTGCFGRTLLGRLDSCSIDLYVAHSLVRSFSTWRLWQVASTSALLVAEPGDMWPFTNELIVLPRIELYPTDNIRATAERLIHIARAPFKHLPREAHALARKFPMERIVSEFLLSAFEELRAWNQ